MTRLSPGHVTRAAIPAFALVALTLPSAAGAQASRTWVSGVGDDANPCSRTAPCKTFAGAISKTAAKGEINVEDPGGFGTVTITKSITIDASHIPSGITASGTNGITINAANTDKVYLRGLNIDGLGTGLSGVRILEAGTVRIEDSKIFGFVNGVESNVQSTNQHRLSILDTKIHGNSAAGVLVSSGVTDAPSRVTINRTSIDDNGDGLVADSTTGRAKVTVVHSSIADNGSPTPVAPATGAGIISKGLNSQVRIGDVDITGNAIGLSLLNGGSVLSFGDNHIFANLSDGTPNGKIPLS